MIALTVKTLDSQNHHFSVEDDITVQEFKVKIAETVNIPADTQRIIYCGRVLQDNVKLNDYDVNGKVVHLVQRAPPGQNPPRTPTPPPTRRSRIFEPPNAMYLTSMAFPGELVDSSGHSLTTTKTMLNRAEARIVQLENQTGSNQSQTSENVEQQEEDREEEAAGPVLEATVVIPGIRNVESQAETLDEVIRDEVEQDQRETGSEEASASGASSEGNNPGNARRGRAERLMAENTAPPSEMATLLRRLNSLQTRFAPFVEQYITFMTEDPVVASESVAQTQTTLDRVSDVFHLLGHAYHSLSDMITCVRSQPPRRLHCYPVPVQQHSAAALVQAGIPIQVEAQINVSTERTQNAADGAERENQNGSSTMGANPMTANPSGMASSQAGGQQPSVSIRGFPTMVPGAAIRMQSFPIRSSFVSVPTTSSSSTANSSSSNNNNNQSAPAPTAPSAPSVGDNANQPNVTNPMPTGSFNVGNSSVEFFMEVTPEVFQTQQNATPNTPPNSGANASNNNAAPPPEFLQSLLQMAGHIMNRVASQQPPPGETGEPVATTTASSASNSTNQSTQARVDSRTTPTRSTHTRSTARPQHVHHVTNHHSRSSAMFDSRLVCSSHHLPWSRQFRMTRQQLDMTEDMRHIFDEMVRRSTGIRQPQHRHQQGARRQADASTATSSAPPPPPSSSSSSSAQTPGLEVPDVDILNLLANALDVPQPEIVPEAGGSSTTETASGQRGVVNELVALLSRSLTMSDVMSLAVGNYAPLQRFASQLQSVISRHVLPDGATDPVSVDRAVDRLMIELLPLIEALNEITPRPDLDVVRSVENLLRSRLPQIVRAVASSSMDNVAVLGERCVLLVRQLCTLLERVSENGMDGVEEAIRRILISHNVNIVPSTSDFQIGALLTCLRVSELEIEEYVARVENNFESTSSLEEEQVLVEEPMDLDISCAPVQSADELAEEDTAMPQIVLGSEPWHGQVAEDWVPIIARDVQRQRRQSAQQPYSDAYLAGMPNKRRKIVNGTKPQGSLPQVIAEGVRRAVTSSGLNSAANLDVVSQAAGESPEIQNAYRSLLRTTVQTSLRDNQDFAPERFPNASNYFGKQ